MSRRFPIAVFAAVLSVTAAAGQEPAFIEPGSVHQWQGLTVVSPDEAGWVLAASDGNRIVFEKRSETAVLRASVSIIRTEIYKTGEAFFAGLEPFKEEEWRGLEVDHLHFNRMGGRGGPFLQYDAIFKLDDTASPVFRYLDLRGRLYPYKRAKGMVVQVEYSVRSGVRGFSEEQMALAEGFLAKVALPRSPARPV
jgi:hypothetical protein